MWIRPAEAAAEQTASNRAVRPVEFQNTQAERHLPAGNESEEFDRTEMVERSQGEVGQVLDLVG